MNVIFTASGRLRRPFGFVAGAAGYTFAGLLAAIAWDVERRYTRPTI